MRLDELSSPPRYPSKPNRLICSPGEEKGGGGS